MMRLQMIFAILMGCATTAAQAQELIIRKVRVTNDGSVVLTANVDTTPLTKRLRTEGAAVVRKALQWPVDINSVVVSANDAKSIKLTLKASLGEAVQVDGEGRLVIDVVANSHVMVSALLDSVSIFGQRTDLHATPLAADELAAPQWDGDHPIKIRRLAITAVRSPVVEIEAELASTEPSPTPHAAPVAVASPATDQCGVNVDPPGEGAGVHFKGNKSVQIKVVAVNAGDSVSFALISDNPPQKHELRNAQASVFDYQCPFKLSVCSTEPGSGGGCWSSPTYRLGRAELATPRSRYSVSVEAICR